MAGWMKMVLGVVLSLGICGGVAAFVYDLHPMRPNYNVADERCPEDTPGPDQRLECYDDHRRIMDGADGSDRWAALGAGVAAVALFWLLANLLYFRPRRRKAEQTGPL